MSSCRVVQLPLGNGSAEQALQFVPDCPVAAGLLADLGCRFFSGSTLLQRERMILNGSGTTCS